MLFRSHSGHRAAKAASIIGKYLILKDKLFCRICVQRGKTLTDQALCASPSWLRTKLSTKDVWNFGER
jgi:hypothetical protein